MKKKVFIITSEASADLLGAKLLSIFKKHKSDIKFYGIGGEHLGKCKNFKKLFDIKLFSIMGFFEVLKNIRSLIKNINNIKKAIIEIKPDMIITIDGSSLAKNIVKWIRLEKKLDFKCPICIHYVAPQVWAWRASRAEIFSKIFDKILCFFNFETKYFLKYNNKVKCPVIGYTPIENLNGNKQKFLKNFPNSANKKIITILPGSRKNEIYSIMETYRQVVEKIYDQNKNTIFFIPVVPFLKNDIVNIINNWNKSYRPYIINNNEDKYNLFAATYIALSISGTVVSELSYFNVPTIVSYKFNYFTALLARIFVKIKFASLINIINNKMIQTELLQEKANPDNIFKKCSELLTDKKKYMLAKQKIKNGMQKLIIKGGKKPSELAYNEIMTSLSSLH